MLLLRVLAAWAALAVVILVGLVPSWPTSVGGWILLLVVGPPAYLGGEWAFGRLLAPELGARISPARCSVARIAVALLLMLLVLVPAMWAFARLQ